MQQPIKYPRPTAFTIVELLITLMIVSIFALVAIPRYASALARYRAESTAKRIVADIQFARAQSRQLSKSVAVTFDSSNKSYSISNVASPIRGLTYYNVDLSVAPYLATVNASSFGTTRTVTFDMYGNASAGGTVVVRSGLFIYTVTLDKPTGKVTYQ